MDILFAFIAPLFHFYTQIDRTAGFIVICLDNFGKD
jgi:hypothetical protein